jgi:hypothetical protein
MATIQIEAEMSTEQLLHAVEQLPPREFTVLLAHLLERARNAAQAEPASTGNGTSAEPNPYLAAAGMFADDSFADEVDAYIAAQREREREDAAREADA